MQVRNQVNRSPRRGAALIYAVLVAFSASALVSVLMTLSLSSTRTAKVKRDSTQARYLAEAGIETAKREVVTSIANWIPVPAQGSATVAGSTANYQVTPTGFQSIVTDPSGIQRILTGYEMASTAAAENHNATVHRMINAEATPIFQFAVFYDDDLEINPGPSMTLGGRVHSNSNMYLNSNNTLTLDTNYVRAVGGIYRHRKDDPSKSQGNVTIRKYVDDPFDPSEPSEFLKLMSKPQLGSGGIPSTSGYDSNFTSGYDANGNGSFNDPDDLLPWGPGALEYWSEPAGYAGGSGNTIMTAAHGVGQATVPGISSIQMFEPASNGTHYWDAASEQYLPAAAGAGTHSMGFYHKEADLSIISYADGSIKVYAQDGTDVTGALPVGTIQSGQIFDARQANGSSGKVEVAYLDMEMLKNSGMWPDNGLIYSGAYGAANGTQTKGLELVNGSELAAPLTVVSESSVYVQGDYNTVNKKGAAVIGDAVNLLSNGWDNSKQKGSGLPSADATTFNMAILTGNQVTQGAAYNGGLENLPRFHENWSGVRCNISGSFVNLWESQHATGAWVYGSDRYTAPIRNFSYDTAFNNVANLPPYTPLAVTAVDVAVW